MADPSTSGIYEIVNLVNGKRYVGSAVNIDQRKRQHRSELGKGRHNPILQSAWNKYGPHNFEFRVIELVPNKALLIEREQHHIDALRPEYNCAQVAGSRLGSKLTAENKSRIGAASKKVWSCPEYRKRMSDAHRGRKVTAEQRAKISATQRGRKLSPEHAAKVAANNAARNQSPEHRALMSERWKGRVLTPEHMAAFQAGRAKRVYTDEQREVFRAQTKARYENGTLSREKSPEVRAKISASLTGRKMPVEVREKQIGRKANDETRRKMTESQKRRWALRRSAQT